MTETTKIPKAKEADVEVQMLRNYQHETFGRMNKGQEYSLPKSEATKLIKAKHATSEF